MTLTLSPPSRVAPAPPALALPRPRRGDADVVDLGARRRDALAREAARRAAAAAPVRHLPAALLEALQGSWGTPEELGLVRRTPVLRSV